MRIIKDRNYFYIQETASDHYYRTGIDCNVGFCTLGKFKNKIYVGPWGFETLEEAQEILNNIDTINVGFVPDKERSLIDD